MDVDVKVEQQKCFTLSWKQEISDANRFLMYLSLLK
ncbi:MAG: hypothetical protein PWR19_803 [Carnobacterium sp.]|jgi:hypothetical protein|nr:hypothetical protein [Carnobacterium sp.]